MNQYNSTDSQDITGVYHCTGDHYWCLLWVLTMGVYLWVFTMGCLLHAFSIGVYRVGLNCRNMQTNMLCTLILDLV